MPLRSADNADGAMLSAVSARFSVFSDSGGIEPLKAVTRTDNADRMVLSAISAGFSVFSDSGKQE
jgi:hypothetical protein